MARLTDDKRIDRIATDLNELEGDDKRADVICNALEYMALAACERVAWYAARLAKNGHAAMETIRQHSEARDGK